MNKKSILTSIFLLSISLSFFSCTSSVKKKFGCISGNCRNGKGTYIYNNKNKYIGQFRAGKPYGFGTMYYKNGVVLKENGDGGNPI